MNVWVVNWVIQGVLLFLIVVIFLIIRLGTFKRKLWQEVISTAILGIFMIVFVMRVGSFNTGGLYYIHDNAGTFRKVNYTRMTDRGFTEYGISDEVITNSSPYDKVKLSIKEDTSGVSFWDVLLCKRSKWMTAELVDSTDYAVLKGKDLVLFTEKVLIPGLFVHAQNRTYVAYNGYRYEVNLPECGIKDDDWYVLVWDTLSLSNGCYSVCKLEKYEGK